MLLRAGDGVAKLDALDHWREAKVYSALERVVLAYAEAMTLTDQDVDDAVYAAVSRNLGERELVELTAWVCLENFYSKFNRSFRVEAQGFCRVPQAGATEGGTAGERG